jgi:hypothetical protein
MLAGIAPAVRVGSIRVSGEEVQRQGKEKIEAGLTWFLGWVIDPH